MRKNCDYIIYKKVAGEIKTDISKFNMLFRKDEKYF